MEGIGNRENLGKNMQLFQGFKFSYIWSKALLSDMNFCQLNVSQVFCFADFYSCREIFVIAGSVTDSETYKQSAKSIDLVS